MSNIKFNTKMMAKQVLICIYLIVWFLSLNMFELFYIAGIMCPEHPIQMIPHIIGMRTL